MTSDITTIQSKLALLQECSKTLEASKSKLLTTTYKQSVQSHGKSYRFSHDIVTKLLFEASWGDQHDRITLLVHAVGKSPHDFYSRVKNIATNVYGADIMSNLGRPVPVKLLSADEKKNTWYWLLSKTIAIAIKTNEFYIHEYKRKVQKFEHDEREIIKQSEARELSIQRAKEQQEHNDGVLKLQSAMTALATEDWDD